MGVDPRSLQIGQAIVVKELNFGVQINLCGDGEAGLTVVEVSPEHLVLDDADGGTRRIPLYLINKSAPVPVEDRAA
ncbi:MAG TPA: hypothetical protein VH682_25060 [Gemmataceae bacterium]|jgi:hypothetical protein